MRKLFLILAAFIFCFTCVMSAVAQTPDRFNYSNYNPLTKGVFANFTFPARTVFEGSTDDDGRKFFTLKNGIFYPKFDENGYIIRLGTYLKSVDFADVTGDGRKEAIVIVGNLCDCSGVWFGVYIYKMAGRKPSRLLWSFRTGDRAVGGLRRVYARKGNLIVELYGLGSAPNKPPQDYHGAQCCTNDYTQRKYRWNGKRFVQRGKRRLLTESEV